MTGHHYVMFGWSLAKMSVLSSQVFGKASTDSSAVLDN